MLQYSKILLSRDEWKAKATTRGNDLREQRKTIKRYQQRILDLNAQVKALKTANAIGESTQKN